MNKIAFEVPQDYTLTKDRDTLKLVWHIQCDSDQTPQSIRGIAGVPYIGSPSPIFSHLRASKIRFTMCNPRYFRAEAEYSTNSMNFSAETDLADRPPEIRYFDDSESVPLEFCYTGDESDSAIPVLNSAGDVFPSVPLVPRLRQRIEILWYASSIHRASMRKCLNTLNCSSIIMDGITYGIHTLWCVRLQTSPRYNASGREFTKVELTLRYDPENWNCKLLQCGFHALSADGHKYPVRLNNGVLQADGTPGTLTAAPVPLDSGGHILQNSPACYGEFRYLHHADWSALGIPSAAAVPRKTGE